MRTSLRTLGISSGKHKRSSAASLDGAPEPGWLSFGSSGQVSHTPLEPSGSHGGDAAHARLAHDDEDRGLSSPRGEAAVALDSSSSTEKLFERIGVLEEKLAAEKARADAYYDQLQDALMRAEGAEQVGS